MTWTLSGDSPWTWVQHAAVAVLVPALLPLLWGGGAFDTVAVSALLLAVFFYRERGDRARKIRDGTWNDKWKRDRAGDLLGPTTATACYSLAWMVT